MMTSTIAFSLLLNVLVSQPQMGRTLPYLQEMGDVVDTVSERKAVLNTLIKELKDRYVVPAFAVKIEGELVKWMKTDEFEKLDDPMAFSTRVNEILKDNVTDAHLRFRYSPNVLPVRREASEPSEEENRAYETWVRRMNSSFRAVERLEGNIGYFAFDSFQSPEDIKRPVAAAMQFLSNTDAMIIDLRSNGGGDPSGVQVVCSYFFGETPVHLNSIYFRPTDETIDFWTLKELDAPRFLDKPVYVLVSNRTGSGAEECAYNLQQLKRATIIGESTWGGANPGGTVRLSDHYSCFIPVGRAINPYTKTNWEGIGVIPDIKVDPAKARETAQLMIAKELHAKESDAGYRIALESLIERLESTGK